MVKVFEEYEMHKRKHSLSSVFTNIKKIPENFSYKTALCSKKVSGQVAIHPSRRPADSSQNRRIAGVCFELHFRVTPGQFRSAAASSLHRRLALLATSTRPSFSKNAYLGILFAPMYQKYSLDFV